MRLSFNPAFPPVAVLLFRHHNDLACAESQLIFPVSIAVIKSADPAKQQLVQTAPLRKRRWDMWGISTTWLWLLEGLVWARLSSFAGNRRVEAVHGLQGTRSQDGKTWFLRAKWDPRSWL